LHSHDFAKALLTAAGGLMMRSVAASNSEGREAVVLKCKQRICFVLPVPLQQPDTYWLWGRHHGSITHL